VKGANPNKCWGRAIRHHYAIGDVRGGGNQCADLWTDQNHTGQCCPVFWKLFISFQTLSLTEGSQLKPLSVLPPWFLDYSLFLKVFLSCCFEAVNGPWCFSPVRDNCQPLALTCSLVDPTLAASSCARVSTSPTVRIVIASSATAAAVTVAATTAMIHSGACVGDPLGESCLLGCVRPRDDRHTGSTLRRLFEQQVRRLQRWAVPRHHCTRQVAPVYHDDSTCWGCSRRCRDPPPQRPLALLLPALWVSARRQHWLTNARHLFRTETHPNKSHDWLNDKLMRNRTPPRPSHHYTTNHCPDLTQPTNPSHSSRLHGEYVSRT